MLPSRRASLLALALLAAGRPASSQTEQDRSLARAFAVQADEKASAGQLDEAIALFRKADALVPAPSLKLAVAHLLVQKGKLVEAQELMQDIARSPPVALEPAPWTRARAEAAAAAAALAPRLCRLEIHLRGAPDGSSPRVTLDREPLAAASLGVPRVVDPGTHQIDVELPGFKLASQSVELAEGQRLKITIALEALPPPSSKRKDPPPESSSAIFLNPAPPPSSPTPPGTRANQGLLWGGLAVTGVFALSGTVTGLLAQRRADDLRTQCPDNRCPLSLKEDVDSARSLATLSTASFVLSGLGLGLAVTGLVLRENVPPSPSSTLRWHVGPASLAVAGSF
jgi:hypothetical protein